MYSFKFPSLPGGTAIPRASASSVPTSRRAGKDPVEEGIKDREVHLANERGAGFLLPSQELVYLLPDLPDALGLFPRERLQVPLFQALVDQCQASISGGGERGALALQTVHFREEGRDGAPPRCHGCQLGLELGELVIDHPRLFPLGLEGSDRVLQPLDLGAQGPREGPRAGDTALAPRAIETGTCQDVKQVLPRQGLARWQRITGGMLEALAPQLELDDVRRATRDLSRLVAYGLDHPRARLVGIESQGDRPRGARDARS